MKLKLKCAVYSSCAQRGIQLADVNVHRNILIKIRKKFGLTIFPFLFLLSMQLTAKGWKDMGLSLGRLINLYTNMYKKSDDQI